LILYGTETSPAVLAGTIRRIGDVKSRGGVGGLGATMLGVGEWAPDFTLPADDGHKVSLKDFRGKKVVLYFYPKDDTTGCTKEACSFRDNLGRVTTKGAVVLGVSRDDTKSHVKFKDKYHLNFPLLSDDDGHVTTAYDGSIAKVWRKVKVEGHTDEVLAAL